MTPWLGTAKRAPGHREALGRVKAWTRARFSLTDDDAILVSELACAVPGCPPVETVVAFWTASDRRHHFKVFKPVADITEDDLPPSWMKDALLFDPMLGCECC
jgi:nitrate reductase delta subunit